LFAKLNKNQNKIIKKEKNYTVFVILKNQTKNNAKTEE